jgi:amidase
MSDPTFMSATELATEIRHGRLASREVLEHFLERIEQRNEPVNAVVTLDTERARQAADDADEAMACGMELGPLHGVPMTVKDSFMTAGMRTTSGAVQLGDFVPEDDAMAVRRLRAAGAIIFGKTNLPAYAADIQTYNDMFGTTNNPWDLNRSPGGSSGGSAAALAAGFTPLELGSDIGGSIRIPAAMCGVMGHKPSFGILPAGGQIPGSPGTLTEADIAVVGPMARRVEDLELALDVLAGPNDSERVAWRLELPLPRRNSTDGYRIAAWFDEPACQVDAEMRTLLERTAAALAEAGATISTDARPDIDFVKAIEAFERLLAGAMAGAFSHEKIEIMAARGTDSGPERWSSYNSQRHRAWLSSNERRLQLRRKWFEFFRDWDALLLPVCPLPAIEHDHSRPMTHRTITVNGESRDYQSQMHWAGLVGVAYLPVTVVPVGRTSAGLPVGIQIVGPYLEDRTTLDIARRLVEIHGGFEPPPGF